MKQKTLVLAVDGVPYSLVERLCSDRVMPSLTSLIGEGSFRAMTSVLPTVSAVAWSAFLTGKNPGEFGVYGFYELDNELNIRFPDRTWLRTPTILSRLTQLGFRTMSVGVPMTYPPDPLEGPLVSGFLAPGLEKAVYPPELRSVLEAVDYRLDVDLIKAQENRDYLRGDALACLQARERAFVSLIERPWDLLICHVIEPDRVNHFFWDEIEGPSARRTGWATDFYSALDHLLGTVMAAAGSDTEVMVLSDHGFCHVDFEVQLNKWLALEGYLKIAGNPSRSHFQALSPDSSAVALVPGRIHILTPTFWKNGSVGEDKCQSLAEEIASKLSGLRHPGSGRKVCRRVLMRDEAFEGAHASRAPDLVIEPEDGFDLKASLTATDVFTSTTRTGMHTYGDAFVCLRNGELPSGPMNIASCGALLEAVGQE